MAKLNENFFNLKKNYLFIDIGKRVKAYTAAHPEAKLIRMGIGDVTAAAGSRRCGRYGQGFKGNGRQGDLPRLRGQRRRLRLPARGCFQLLQELRALTLTPPLSTSATVQRATAAT